MKGRSHFVNTQQKEIVIKRHRLLFETVFSRTCTFPYKEIGHPVRESLLMRTILFRFRQQWGNGAKLPVIGWSSAGPVRRWHQHPGVAGDDFSDNYLGIYLAVRLKEVVCIRVTSRLYAPKRNVSNVSLRYLYGGVPAVSYGANMKIRDGREKRISLCFACKRVA